MKVTGPHAYRRSMPVSKMPTGLVELMEGMTKEVLRCNPTNINEFCAAHLQKLLEIRDGSTGKRELTLEQKISWAQDKIKLRAQKRQQKYDKDIQMLCEKGNKDEEFSLQIAKVPVTNEIYVTNVEEIEKNEDVLTTTKEISKSVDSNIHGIIKESENNSTILHVKTGLIVNEHVDVDTELNEVFEHFEAPRLKDSVEVFENEMVSKSFPEKISNVMEENVIKSDKLVSTNLEKDNKLEEVMIFRVDQDSEKKSKESLLNNDEVNVSISYSNTMESEKGNSVHVLTDDYLFDDVELENPMNKESVSKDYTIYKNDKEEKSAIIIENNSKTNTTTKNNDDIPTPTTFTPNEGVTDNPIITTDDVSGSNQTAHTLPSLGEETVIASKHDERTNLETKNNNIVDKIDLPSFCHDIPSTVEDFFDKSTDSVANEKSVTNNMDLETAAITIQKVFRSFLFKSRASNDETSSIYEDIKEANGYSSPNLSNDRRVLGLTRMDTMLQTVNEEKSLSLSTDDSSTLSSAATIIQAHIRGFLVRNKLNSNKTASTNSILNSEDPVTPSKDFEADQNQNDNKTVLNIHIVPDNNVPPLSRDESIVTSMDLSLDSPPSPINLHPLGYDKSEPRKQLKREDAIQSISPPSNNSGKLSEDSTKEILINYTISDYSSGDNLRSDNNHTDKIPILTDVRIVSDNSKDSLGNNSENIIADQELDIKNKENILTKMNSDEMDVVTASTQGENEQITKSSNTLRFEHSGELHDVVLPTNVSRGSTSVVRGE